MIVLDTNVVSELMRPQPEMRVMAWLQTQAIQELATTTITLAEIGLGLARLPESRRRFNLETKFQAFISRGLARAWTAGPRVRCGCSGGLWRDGCGAGEGRAP